MGPKIRAGEDDKAGMRQLDNRLGMEKKEHQSGSSHELALHDHGQVCLKPPSRHIGTPKGML